jgi:hypothetical protein
MQSELVVNLSCFVVVAEWEMAGREGSGGASLVAWRRHDLTVKASGFT